ncbi:phosphoglycolate phosphatase-like HAD superfamily hydrolase [Agrobacterium vitis]|nr:phosphoglycolate phosphatase-like HAD superfamily hydrolase [Agrobacterium vitis]MBE1436633.1 phosphoglycolate phosphatase-like HAD superfamily hydrolase [Agrobacterium vitis]
MSLKSGRPVFALVDFDGTLMDSTADLVELTRLTLAEWDIYPDPVEMASFLGLPTRERLRRHGVAADALSEAAARFLHHHTHCKYQLSSPMPGASEWLGHTPEVPKWIVSASPYPAVMAGLRYHGLDGAFSHILAAPPHADGMDKIKALAPHHGLLSGFACWMLGDQENDYQAALSLDARFALMGNERNSALRPIADRILNCFNDLLTMPLE